MQNDLTDETFRIRDSIPICNAKFTNSRKETRSAGFRACAYRNFFRPGSVDPYKVLEKYRVTVEKIEPRVFFLKRSFPVFRASPILWKIETRIRRHRILFNFSPREYIENTSRFTTHPLPSLFFIRIAVTLVFLPPSSSSPLPLPRERAKAPGEIRAPPARIRVSRNSYYTAFPILPHTHTHTLIFPSRFNIVITPHQPYVLRNAFLSSPV